MWLTALRSRHSNYTILPTAHYNCVQDEFCFEQEGTSVPNTGLTCVPVLFGSHWIGIEIDRQHQIPDITTLEAPRSMQNRLEFFICHLLQIPAHRLHIQHGMDVSPPNMCGWGLLWRWANLMHAQDAFRDVQHQLHVLADVNRRIIHRALQSSIEAWAVTGASDTLQQVAYTMRLSFLVHLFHFDAGIHSCLDSLAISAAGQPLEVFADHDNLPTAVNTPELPPPPTQPEVLSTVVEAPESHEIQAQSHPWSDAIDGGEDLLQQHDPWANWSTTSSTRASSSSSRLTKKSEASSQMQTQISIQKTELSQMKDRLQKLEESSAKKEQNDKTNITRDMKSFQQEVRHEIKEFEQKYESSLERALAKTESKLEGSMNSAIAQLQNFIQNQNKQQKRSAPSPAKSDASMPEHET